MKIIKQIAIIPLLAVIIITAGCAAKDDNEYWFDNQLLYKKITEWQARESLCQDTGYREGVLCVDTIIACYDTVITQVEYRAERNLSDYWQTTDETANTGKGDCEDIASLQHRLCRESGIGDEFIFIGVFRQDSAVNDGKYHMHLCVAPTGDPYESYPVKGRWIPYSNPRLIAGYNLQGYWTY